MSAADSCVRVAVLLWGVLIGCACGEASPEPAAIDAEPVADATAPYVARCERVVLSPDPELRLATITAAERWERATGCAIEVGEGGVPVVAATPILRPDGSEAPGATSEDRRLVRIDPRHRRRTDVITHELGHVLGGEHRGEGLMSDRPGRGTALDADSLAEVCEALDCAAFVPELVTESP